MRMTVLVAILILAAVPADVADAAADRAQYPASEWPYLYYVSSRHLDGELKDQTEAALAFVVASASRQPILEKCVPVRVADGLYRLSLRDLQWDAHAWSRALIKGYPYGRHPGKSSLVIRADWLIAELTDTTQSKLYYQLLYGRDDLDRDGFLKFWSVNADASSHFGVITKSRAANGPSVSGIRLIENRPTSNRGSAWGTRDSAKIDKGSDPLEHLDNNFRHDAEEWLVAMPKVSLASGKRGLLLAAWLNNGAGKRQEEAPAAIVTDHAGFRGQFAIRNWGSCINCHATGLNDPGVSELRQYIAAGVDVYAQPKKLAEQIELFHLSDAGKQLRRDNEDFGQAIKIVNGLDGEDNAAAYRAAIQAYDAAVTPATAAAEVYATLAELRLAIAYYNANGGKVGARLAGLAHDKTLPRAAWEDHWYTAYLAVQAWRSK